MSRGMAAHCASWKFLLVVWFLLVLRRAAVRAFTAVPSRRAVRFFPLKSSTVVHIIEVSSKVDLPFSAEVGFEAFSDLERQPTFSPWLKQVTFTNGSTKNGVGAMSKWTVRFLGLGFSWMSVSTKHDRNDYVLEWESVTGLRNSGRCEFHALSHNQSRMNLSMSFQFGATILYLLGKNSDKVKHLIESRMLTATMQNFIKIVHMETVQSIRQSEEGSAPQTVSISTQTTRIISTRDGFEPVVPQDDHNIL